jgi:diguanylate cyclase (GGDEF)-like protein
MFRNIRNSAVTKQLWGKRSRQLSLPWMLTVPFILQVITVVGWVGYFSYRNGQRSVEDLTNQLISSVSSRVEQKLVSYLETPFLVNQINSNAVRRGDLSLSLERSNAERERYLWQNMQLFNNLTWITLGSEQGESLGVWRPGENQNLQISFSNRFTQYYGNYYATNDQGLRTTLLKIERPAYDPRTRPWYKEAIAAKKPIWNSIYPGFTPGTVFIAASQPLYNTKGRLVGVSGIDISLLNIQKFLEQVQVSPAGKIFLIERSGLLVASNSQEAPFKLIDNKKPQRVNVLDSKIPLVKLTAQSILNRFGNFKTIEKHQKFQFSLNQEAQFVQVFPFSMPGGLDWLIVIVVPESDVMAQIHAGTQTTVGLCLAALVAVIILNTLISLRIVQPIAELNQASQQMMQGDFSGQIQPPTIHELSKLAKSFKQMQHEILLSRQQLEEYSRSLEQKVSDRTQALQQEIVRRASAEVALQSANQKLQLLAYLDGLTQIANRRQLDERLKQELRRMKRERLPLSLILCDVDYFKQYNDTYGHQMGDDCLRRIAKVMEAAVRRPSDLAARYGGEEFAILLPSTPISGALEVAREIQTHIRYLQIPHESSQVSPYVTSSFGIASLVPNHSTTPEELLELADQALYQAKLGGRDRIAIH